MDLTFFRRGRQPFVGRSAAGLDYGVLVATLQAMQSATAAARAELASEAPADVAPTRCDPLVELLLGGSAWREAAAAQRGCFNFAQARACGNRP